MIASTHPFKNLLTILSWVACSLVFNKPQKSYLANLLDQNYQNSNILENPITNFGNHETKLSAN